MTGVRSVYSARPVELADFYASSRSREPQLLLLMAKTQIEIYNYLSS